MDKQKLHMEAKIMFKLQRNKEWVKRELGKALDGDVPDEMVDEIVSFKTPKELENHLSPLLDPDKGAHRHFLGQCKTLLFGGEQAQNKKADKQNQKKEKAVSDKQMGNKSSFNAPAKSGHVEQKDFEQSHQKQQQKQQQPPQQQQQKQTGGKKSKYVSLYATDGNVKGEVIMLKGRHLCDCQATDHALINNCLKCGRIVCAQEGKGPCLFCGELVCSNEEMKFLNSGTKGAINLRKSLTEKGDATTLEKAIEQRDRLLEYDQNSEKRTTVIDDEMDYFQENSAWLTDAQRAQMQRLQEEMHEKKHASRAKRAVKVDFAGRVIDDESLISQELEEMILKEMSIVEKWDNWSSQQFVAGEESDVDPMVGDIRPVYKPTGDYRSDRNAYDLNSGLERRYNRVQDKELLEMQDMRSCLSMHQPWASLLVAGIKIHEGRNWYSEHRGRLWIAATAKEPNPNDIKEAETFYKLYHNNNDLKFPKYPIGCLLGCVKVEDCLPQEEYREIYPGGESESPYVFICSNPEQLPSVFPIQGCHKIYQIDPKLHMLACKALLRTRATKNE